MSDMLQTAVTAVLLSVSMTMLLARSRLLACGLHLSPHFSIAWSLSRVRAHDASMGSPPPSPSPVPSPCASGSPAPSLHRQPRLHLPHRGTSRLQLARSVSAKSDLSLAATTPADVTAAAAAAAVNAGTGTGESSDGPPAHAPLPAAVDYKGKGRATQDEQGVSDQPQGMVKVKDYALADDGDDDTTPAASTSSRPTSIDNREEEEDEVEMAAQPEGDVDPRTMLREQLKRSESARASASTSNSPRESAIPLPPRSRAQSYRSGLSVPRSAGEARGRPSLGFSLCIRGP